MSKNTENWWKKGENFRILTSSESKIFEFYTLDIICEKKYWGYFLKKSDFFHFWRKDFFSNQKNQMFITNSNDFLGKYSYNHLCWTGFHDFLKIYEFHPYPTQ